MVICLAFLALPAAHADVKYSVIFGYKNMSNHERFWDRQQVVQKTLSGNVSKMTIGRMVTETQFRKEENSELDEASSTPLLKLTTSAEVKRAFEDELGTHCGEPDTFCTDATGKHSMMNAFQEENEKNLGMGQEKLRFCSTAMNNREIFS